MAVQAAKNVTKAKMKAGSPALGMIIRGMRSAEIVRIAKASGHDFVFVDRQHALFDLETVGQIAQAGLGCGVDVLVRVRSCDDADMPLLLDNGAMGIVVPDVNTAAEARRVVDACKYAPVGNRSAGGGATFFDFKPVPAGESLAAMNNETLVICMIETPEGVRNVDEIAATPGLDVLHVGCNDLLVRMGRPGDFGSAELADAIRRVIDAGRKHGVFVGVGGDKDVKRQAQYVRDGVRFVTTLNDISFLLAEATRFTADLRKAFEA